LSLLTAYIALLSFTAFAQVSSNLPYLDAKLSPKERAADLVHRMPVQEKASQLSVSWLRPSFSGGLNGRHPCINFFEAQPHN
jgi:hypothetical protein